MAMSRRANNNARVSKRKGSRKGSKRVSRKGKKSSRKGTKKRGMIARLMGRMRRGKRSSRKSKGRKNNNVAVLVPAKGSQRGGAFPTNYPTNTPKKTVLNGAVRFAFADNTADWYSEPKASLAPTDVNLEGTNYKMYLVPTSDIGKMKGPFKKSDNSDITVADAKVLTNYEETDTS